jgi:hypothetical protein
MVRPIASALKWMLMTSAAAIFVASCSYKPRSAGTRGDTSAPHKWFLIAAPFTQEFPGGNLQAPLSKWPQITTFDAAETCEAGLQQAGNELQRPVQCIGSDDPRLNEQTGAMGDEG